MSSETHSPYLDYKESDVTWLGKIPRNWRVCRVKDFAQLVSGFPFDSKKFDPVEGIPLVRIRDIDSARTEVRVKGDVPQESLIRNGDVLIGMDGDFNVAWWEAGEAALNQRVACLRANPPALQRFYYYALPFNMKIVNDLTYFTTVKHLSNTDILKTRFAMPSSEELSNIVAFLDYETAKIDALIEKQQQLIALLGEKRQAVISHAVTKGLNPDAPMRDSGVEWLGEVPEHWAVARAKHVASVFLPQRNKPELNSDGDGVCWVTMEQMQTDYISDSPLAVSDKASQAAGSKVLKSGSVVASCVGQFEVAAINKVDVIINQQLQAYIPNEISAAYLRLLVLLSRSYFERIGTAATIVYVNQKGFDEMPVIVPPKDEQCAIVEQCESYFAKIDALVSDVEYCVELLRERRTALISAAVTGKIDVRGWKRPSAAPKKETEMEVA